MSYLTSLSDSKIKHFPYPFASLHAVSIFFAIPDISVCDVYECVYVRVSLFTLYTNEKSKK